MKLQDLLKKHPHLSLLDIKLRLIRKKKEGIYFYEETMSHLKEDESFIIYDCHKKFKGQKHHVFPVPNTNTRTLPTMEVLKTHYKHYHQTEDIPTEINFSTLSVFKGEKWIWYWNDTICEKQLL